MPKAGFKSITVKEEIYNDLFSKYEKLKPLLIKIGINSFSGFLAFTFEKLIGDKVVFKAFLNSISEDTAKTFEQLRIETK